MKSISEENLTIRPPQLERTEAIAISISGLGVHIIPAISLLAAMGAMILGLLSIPRMDLGSYVVRKYGAGVRIDVNYAVDKRDLICGSTLEIDKLWNSR